ncbi:hypothetical protein Q0S99_04230 [Stenotrophomonas indicatrix]|uniref:hypothetical protein n=1 Tax=Stenotrophomonas indicatrix TaxID=2045451 RepID=UPI0026569065|nr:hypothetical protein [Stenotrophomonas indicatrix]MDN8654497.1 hypothetical protein [Stenotrophomonas indicatrix]
MPITQNGRVRPMRSETYSPRIAASRHLSENSNASPSPFNAGDINSAMRVGTGMCMPPSYSASPAAEFRYNVSLSLNPVIENDSHFTAWI